MLINNSMSKYKYCAPITHLLRIKWTHSPDRIENQHQSKVNLSSSTKHSHTVLFFNIKYTLYFTHARTHFKGSPDRPSRQALTFSYVPATVIACRACLSTSQPSHTTPSTINVCFLFLCAGVCCCCVRWSALCAGKTLLPANTHSFTRMTMNGVAMMTMMMMLMLFQASLCLCSVHIYTRSSWRAPNVWGLDRVILIACSIHPKISSTTKRTEIGPIDQPSKGGGLAPIYTSLAGRRNGSSRSAYARQIMCNICSAGSLITSSVSIIAQIIVKM